MHNIYTLNIYICVYICIGTCFCGGGGCVLGITLPKDGGHVLGMTQAEAVYKHSTGTCS